MDPGSGEVILTTPEAAERLGVSTTRVRQLIWAGRLPSQQFGRDHVIKESDLTLVAERKTGRPSKKQIADSGQPSNATDALDDGAPGTAVRNEKPTKKAKKGSGR